MGRDGVGRYGYAAPLAAAQTLAATRRPGTTIVLIATEGVSANPATSPPSER